LTRRGADVCAGERGPGASPSSRQSRTRLRLTWWPSSPRRTCARRSPQRGRLAEISRGSARSTRSASTGSGSWRWGGPVLPDESAGPALADTEAVLEHQDRAASAGWAQKFPSRSPSTPALPAPDRPRSAYAAGSRARARSGAWRRRPSSRRTDYASGDTSAQRPPRPCRPRRSTGPRPAACRLRQLADDLLRGVCACAASRDRSRLAHDRGRLELSQAPDRTSGVRSDGALANVARTR
jgi:hypothetical protein